jgi:hypothetical protein
LNKKRQVHVAIDLLKRLARYVPLEPSPENRVPLYNALPGFSKGWNVELLMNPADELLNIDA